MPQQLPASYGFALLPLLPPTTAQLQALGRLVINPYVDDGYLGWEANAGVDWKLLEGFKMNVRYSYWAPGDWFTDAYQAVGMGAGGVPIPEPEDRRSIPDPGYNRFTNDRLLMII